MPAYDRFEMCEAINSYVINAKHREVLRLRYCEGYTHEQTGEIVGYSTQHVKHICKAYRDMLLSRMILI